MSINHLKKYIAILFEEIWIFGQFSTEGLLN